MIVKILLLLLFISTYIIATEPIITQIEDTIVVTEYNVQLVYNLREKQPKFQIHVLKSGSTHEALFKNLFQTSELPFPGSESDALPGSKIELKDFKWDFEDFKSDSEIFQFRLIGKRNKYDWNLIPIINVNVTESNGDLDFDMKVECFDDWWRPEGKYLVVSYEYHDLEAPAFTLYRTVTVRYLNH